MGVHVDDACGYDDPRGRQSCNGSCRPHALRVPQGERRMASRARREPACSCAQAVTPDEILDLANAVRLERYADAEVVLAAGSLVRGTGTPFSDLDLVVLCPRLAWAYRESFRFNGCPVEAFIHDPQTLEYFFVEVDRAAGIP